LKLRGHIPLFVGDSHRFSSELGSREVHRMVDYGDAVLGRVPGLVVEVEVKVVVLEIITAGLG